MLETVIITPKAGGTVEGVKDNILRQYHELEARHQALSVADYNTDHVYRKLVEEMLDTLAWAHDASEHGG